MASVRAAYMCTARVSTVIVAGFALWRGDVALRREPGRPCRLHRTWRSFDGDPASERCARTENRRDRQFPQVRALPVSARSPTSGTRTTGSDGMRWSTPTSRAGSPRHHRPRASSTPGAARGTAPTCWPSAAARGRGGLDYDLPTLAPRRRHLPGVRPVQAPTSWPCRSATGAFDAVVSLQVVEHLWEQPRFVGECARVTRPGGWVALSTPNRLTFSPGVARGEKPLNPFHVNELDAEELARPAPADAPGALAAGAAPRAASRPPGRRSTGRWSPRSWRSRTRPGRVTWSSWCGVAHSRRLRADR